MKKEYLYVLIVALLWGTTAAVGKFLLGSLDSFQVYFFIALFSSLSLWVINSFNGKLKKIKSLKKKDFLIFALMGFLGFFAYNLLFYSGLKFLPAQEGFILNYTWPIWVVIISFFILKEKVTSKKIVSILIAFTGAMLVITKGNLSLNFTNPLGIFLMLLAAFFWGLFSVMGKHYNYDSLFSMMFYSTFGLLFITIATLIFSSIPSLSLIEFLGLFWIGFSTNAIAFTLWFLALKIGDTAKVSNLVYLTPFFSLVFISILLKEKILISSIIGLILILAGTLILKEKS